MKQLKYFFITLVCVVLSSCGEDETQELQRYPVAVTAGEGGSAKVDIELAEIGETVCLTATPDAGYVFKEWKVESGKAIIALVTANPATFIMPDGEVTVSANFIKESDVFFTKIADPVFAEYCRSRVNTTQVIDGVTYPKWDADGNGVFTDKEAQAVTAIDLSGLTGKVSDFKGLELFTGLEVFNCASQSFSAIDLSKHTELKTLVIRGNNLTELDLNQNTKLTKLDCSDNKLEYLDVSIFKNLSQLFCDGNHLSELDVTTMVFGDEGTYSLHCGNQTASDGTGQTLVLTLDDDQLPLWENDLQSQVENDNVEFKTIPDVDVYMKMSDVTATYNNGNITLEFTDEKENMVRLVFKAESAELQTGTYSNLATTSRVKVEGGSLRQLDTSAPGSFTVKYNEKTQIYTIEGELLMKSSFTDSRRTVAFYYRGEVIF